MDYLIDYMAKAAKQAARRIGRPSRKDLGLKPVKGVYTKIEVEILEAVVAKFGSVNQALRHAAGVVDN